MDQLFSIIAFWIVVVVAMRLAVCFPRSLLARVFFTPFVPEPLPGEPVSDYLLRRARFGAGWFAQSLVLFAAGWVALAWDATLADSLFFLVLWVVVIPLLGIGAFLVSLGAVCRCIWIHSSGRTLTRIQS